MRRGCVRTALFVAGLATTVALPASADEPPQTESDAASSPVVDVTLAGTDDEAALVRAAVIEQLERLGVRPSIVRRDVIRPDEVVSRVAASGAAAHVWLDFSSPSEAVLYVADGAGERVLVRRFAREGRNEIAREATMAALQSAIDALLHGNRIGVSRDEARAALGLPPPPSPSPKPPPARPPAAPCPAPPPPAPARSATTLGIGAFYEIGAYASHALEHGPLVRVSVMHRSGDRIYGLMLSGQYRFAMTATSPPVTLRVESGALRLAGVLGLVHAPAFDVLAAAGGGFDVTRADPRLIDQVDATLTPISRVDPVVRAGLLGRAPLALLGRAHLELELALDVAPSVHPFAISRGDAEAILLSPWIVRPLVVLGLAVP